MGHKARFPPIIRALNVSFGVSSGRGALRVVAKYPNVLPDVAKLV